MTELLFRTGKELFCSASAVSGTAVAVPGGYSVSGKWGYGSGCLHADWALNGIAMRDGNGEIVETAMAFLDLTDSACTIIDNWHVAGMAGSGRSEENTSELQSLMRISYADFCWKKKTKRHSI